MSKRAVLVANSASMIDHFNRDNIAILKSMGYKVSVAANFCEGNSSTKTRIAAFEQELRKMGIDIIDLPIPRKATQLYKVFVSVVRLKKYLKKNPCEIVHTQTPVGGVVGRIAAKKARKQGVSKVIYFVHGFHFFKGAPIKNYLMYYSVEKALSKYTDCLITLNKEDFDTAQKKFIKTDVRFVPGIGVDTDGISQIKINKEEKMRSLGLPSDKKVILTVAELIPRKNIEGAICAFADIKNKNSILVVCGKGYLNEKLHDLTEKMNISDRVFFLGYRTDILEIYNIADIFLFTSFQEGLPVAVMQAMAAGLPIIASDIRGNRDLLGEKGSKASSDCLINVNNTKGFRERLDELLQNTSKAEQMGKENQERCKKNFDISIVHELMQDIYSELSEEEPS